MSDAVDRLLRRSAAAGAEPGLTGGYLCLDAETAAAWADGSLRGEALLKAQEHTADCARCQALVATLAHTAPAPPVHESVWARWRLQWVVPAAAAATAIALYVAVPGTPSEVLMENEALKSSQEAAPASGAPPVQAPGAPVQVPAPDALSALENSPQSLADAAQPAAPSPSAKAEQAPSPAPPRDALAKSSADAASPAGRDEVKPPPQQFGRADDARARQETDSAAQARRSAPPSAAAPVAPTPPAAAPPPRPDVTSPSAVTFLERVAVLPVEVVSPNPAIRWRVVTPGTIQSSGDGGVTWSVSREGEMDVLTAGASPSASVCWFVGRAGVVLVTSDGRQWSRRLVPGGADLVAIQPTDGRTAAVTAADGRIYRTADGGQTWR